MLTDVLGGTTKGDIKEVPLAMAANNERISLELVSRLHNDTARITNAEEGRHIQPYRFEWLDIVLDLLLHQIVGTAQILLTQFGDHLGRQSARRSFEVVIVDTKHM